MYQYKRLLKIKLKKGFTFIEILIVVIILGVLAAIVIPQFTDASAQSKQSAVQTDLQTVRSQIQLYKIQHNDQLPCWGTATFEQCMAGKTDVSGAVGTNYGPYMQKMPVNVFNNLDTVTAGTANPGSGGSGWYYNISTGTFNANDSNEHAAW